VNIFPTIEEARRYDHVTYYTVRIEVNDKKEDENEFEKWILKHSQNESIKDEYQDLISLLETMGQELSAKKRYFRHEGEADALPPNWKKLKPQEREAHVTYSKNLRLYCMRLTDSVVILFNGIKSDSARTAQECPKVRKFFRQANNFAKSLDEAISNREITVDTGYLKFDTDFEIPIIL
jgi:hypothetical protein